MHTARRHLVGPGRWSVLFDGKLLVERSPDPECDAARALLAKGITDKLTMLDGKTGKPLCIIDIERAARMRTKEGPLRFVPYEGMPNRAPTAEAPVASRGDSLMRVRRRQQLEAMPTMAASNQGNAGATKWH
jgi:hypothetical protein